MRSARAVLPLALFLSFFLSLIFINDIEAADARLRPRPWMGITVMDAHGEASGGRGVVVSDVIKGGPAESAGISASDVITGINGKEVYGVADFVTEIQHLGVGSPVVVELERDGKVRSVDVVLTRRPAGLFGYKGAYPPTAGRGGVYYTGEMAGCGGCGGHGDCLDHSGHGDDIWMSSGREYDKMYFMRVFHLLGLDAAQKKKADSLEVDYRKRSIELGSKIRIGELELEELSAPGKVDLKKVKAKIEDIAATAAELRFMRYRSLEELRRILTPAQRERLDKISLMESAGYGPAGYGSMPGPMRVEVYGTKSCDEPGHGGPLIMEVPAE